MSAPLPNSPPLLQEAAAVRAVHLHPPAGSVWWRPSAGQQDLHEDQHRQRHRASLQDPTAADSLHSAGTTREVSRPRPPSGRTAGRYSAAALRKLLTTKLLLPLGRNWLFSFVHTTICASSLSLQRVAHTHSFNTLTTPPYVREFVATTAAAAAPTVKIFTSTQTSFKVVYLKLDQAKFNIAQ